MWELHQSAGRFGGDGGGHVGRVPVSFVGVARWRCGPAKRINLCGVWSRAVPWRARGDEGFAQAGGLPHRRNGTCDFEGSGPVALRATKEDEVCGV